MGRQTEDPGRQDFKCPECRQPLKRRRTKTPDECELVCGGCGATFDVCDLETLERLKKDRDK